MSTELTSRMNGIVSRAWHSLGDNNANYLQAELVRLRKIEYAARGVLRLQDIVTEQADFDAISTLAAALTPQQPATGGADATNK